MPARTAGLPDIYVYNHKETNTHIVQIATTMGKVLWSRFPTHQIHGTNCLAVVADADLERIFDCCEEHGVNVSVLT